METYGDQLSDKEYDLEDNHDELNFFEEEGGEYNPDKDFTTLEAWKTAREVKLFFYNKIIPLLPNEEKYNLDIQIRKAAISGTATIAEGYGRFHFTEGIQFYRISRASQAELKDHLISCNDLKYINDTIYNEGVSLIEKSKRILNGYIRYTQQQIKNLK